MSSIRLMARRYRMLGAVTGAVILAAGTSVAVETASSASPAQTPPACAAGTNVTTTYGPICGTVDASNGVSEWLAIPYAAPPVGTLRWEPPQAPAPWTSTLQATAYGSECAQQDAFGTVLPLQGSEDCLFVNVFRPAGATAGSNLPVLVHIHGGGFRIGNGQGDYSLLASTGDEVVVSLQYRLGIFGFLADKALGPHSGDYGLQDQQFALRWVRHNITAFGGNAHQVTIFGESAGASSVCDQIASPTAHGLFEGAISTSGEYDGLFGVPGPGETLEVQDCKSALPTQAQADRIGTGFATTLGCTGSAAAVAACLRSAPATDVAQAAGFGGFQYGGHGTIAPTINGTTLTMTLRQALRAGKVNRVAVIAGYGRDEDLVSNETGVALPTTAAAYRALVQAQYGKYAPQVLALYPLSRYYSPYLAFRTVAADSDTVCPGLVTERELARYMPVYGYEMDDGDPPPNTQTVPAGAQHASDPWDLTPTTGLDANMQVLQQQEIAYVTTFGRTGHPTALHTPIWPEFRTGNIMSLAPGGDSESMSIAELQLIHNCGFWDRIAPRPARAG
jgi:para-nitrobenzyl esterase